MDAGIRQVLELPLPCIIGAGKGLNTPKYPTFMDIRKAKKKEAKQIDAGDLDFGNPSSGMEILELKTAVENRQAKEIKGQPEEIVRQLIDVLRNEAKVL